MNFLSPFPTSGSGIIRRRTEDFIVKELPLFTPSGEGEHLWLKIKKNNSNTDWVAGQLAKLLNVKRRDVGFAGLKDRHAVTTQWFSIYLPGKEVNDLSEEIANTLGGSITVLEQTKHQKKLRRGTLKGNQFRIVIRSFEGDKVLLGETLDRIKQQGIANYFGEQRFGHGFSNIEQATAWFNGDMQKPKNRNKRGLYLSAARSWVFNHILAERVTLETWNKARSGDVFMLDSSHSWFVDDVDEQIIQRVEQMDIHPSAALWGRGKLASLQKTLELETAIAEQHSVLCRGLEINGLKQERRALRAKVRDLEIQWLDNATLEVQFSLPSGSYATVLLNQLMGDISVDNNIEVSNNKL